jgi:hypothetical protein
MENHSKIIALTLNIIGIICIIAGITEGCIVKPFETAVLFVISGIISGIIFIGMAAIINLLMDISISLKSLYETKCNEIYEKSRNKQKDPDDEAGVNDFVKTANTAQPKGISINDMYKKRNL